MKLAVDTWMLWFRGDSIRDAFKAVADAGYRYAEFAPREDVFPFYAGSRVTSDVVQEIRAASKATGVEVASFFVEWAWAHPDESVRMATVRAIKRAIEVATDLGVPRINGELTGDFNHPLEGEAALLRTLEEVLPVCEANGVSIALEPHPGDFIESGIGAIDLIRGVGSRYLYYLHCCPHTFYLGYDRRPRAGMHTRPFASSGDIIRYGAATVGHVHIADTFRPEKTFLNPTANEIRVHSHFDVGVGDIDWPEVFQALKDVGFDDVMTVAVWRQEGREEASMRHNRQKIDELMAAVGWSPE
jgi:myo-inositol catabolism protein IolH